MNKFIFECEGESENVGWYRLSLNIYIWKQNKPSTDYFLKPGRALRRVNPFCSWAENGEADKQNRPPRGGCANRRSASRDRRYRTIPSIPAAIQCGSCAIQASKRFYWKFDSFFFCIESNSAIRIGNRTIPISMINFRKLNFFMPY